MEHKYATSLISSAQERDIQANLNYSGLSFPSHKQKGNTQFLITILGEYLSLNCSDPSLSVSNIILIPIIHINQVLIKSKNYICVHVPHNINNLLGISELFYICRSPRHVFSCNTSCVNTGGHTDTPANTTPSASGSQLFQGSSYLQHKKVRC